MLKTKKQKLVALGAAVVVIAGAFFLTRAVINKGNVKEYSLNNVALVVSNSDNCGALFNALTKLSQNPLELEFSSTKEHKKFSVKDSNDSLKNHFYSIVKQNVGETVYRVGIGEFEIEGQKVDYVVTASADVKNPNYKHSYPVILSGDNARCHFTAVLNPDADTAEDFVDDVKSGEVEKTADLSN